MSCRHVYITFVSYNKRVVIIYRHFLSDIIDYFSIISGRCQKVVKAIQFLTKTLAEFQVKYYSNRCIKSMFIYVYIIWVPTSKFIILI